MGRWCSAAGLLVLPVLPLSLRPKLRCCCPRMLPQAKRGVPRPPCECACLLEEGREARRGDDVGGALAHSVRLSCFAHDSSPCLLRARALGVETKGERKTDAVPVPGLVLETCTRREGESVYATGGRLGGAEDDGRLNRRLQKSAFFDMALPILCV